MYEFICDCGSVSYSSEAIPFVCSKCGNVSYARDIDKDEAIKQLIAQLNEYKKENMELIKRLSAYKQEMQEVNQQTIYWETRARDYERRLRSIAMTASVM